MTLAGTTVDFLEKDFLRAGVGVVQYIFQPGEVIG